MSPRPWKDRIDDILTTIEEIETFVSGMTYEQFVDDLRTQKAVLADLTIIGEAAGHMPPELASRHPEIPWHLMRGMRNRLVHDYFSVDPRIVWETVQQDLPLVKQPLAQLRDNEP